ncbi:hypothetical protein JHK85_005524 [Glycine max]|nr:hypothetical protein JHK85_005524 [Glycine max]KAG5081296.1 hypothetical protein JHK86_005361 [Glycine max]
MKEVLSETPKWKPKFKAEKPIESNVENQKEKLFVKPNLIFEVFKVCSVSESVCTLVEEETHQMVNKSLTKSSTSLFEAGKSLLDLSLNHQNGKVKVARVKPRP